MGLSPTDSHTGTTNNYHSATPAHHLQPAPRTPHFHLVACTKQTPSTSFTPQPPFPFLSRHALIQPIKTSPSTQQCKHDSSYHTPNPHSGYFTSAKRRIPQELQTSFKNKHISLLTNHHPFQPKYSSRVSTLSQHLQSPHTTRTALTQPTSFLKEDPPPPPPFPFF